MRFRERLSTGRAYITKNATVILLFLVLGIGTYFLVKDAIGKVTHEANISNRDTTITVTQITQPTIKTEKYIPYEFKDTDTILIKEVQIPQKYIPSEDIAQLKQQVKELGQELFKTRKFRDSIKLKDTSGINVGIVNINDEISENTIKSRQVDYTLSFPQKTITITNTVQEPKRTQVYIGLEGGMVTPIIPQAGVGIIIKNKQDNIFRIGGGTSLGLKPYVEAGIYKKLSFRKK